MNTKDYLKSYIMKRLAELETAKQEKGIMPTHVTGHEAHDTFMDDAVSCIAELRESGMVEQGRCLNDIYLKVELEG